MSLRGFWLAATTLLTVAPIVLAAAAAPSGSARPASALVWLLFVGSSMHVGATAWFYTLPEVRAHMRTHLLRYVWVPMSLVLVVALASVVLPTAARTWGLLAFFAWQFFHFQKQNLGVAALTARACGAGSLTGTQRRCLVVAGLGGICALIGHPHLLQVRPAGSVLGVLYPTGAVLFVGAAAIGLATVVRHLTTAHGRSFAAVYAISVLFFAPVFLFASPYAAVAGLTIAHGLQYLLLLGLLARTPSGGRPVFVGALVLLNIALVAGLALNQAAHLHGDGPVGRLVFGAYLGLVMSHFVVDAGLWRLRNEFPRRFLTQRLPFLLTPVDIAAPAAVRVSAG